MIARATSLMSVVFVEETILLVLMSVVFPMETTPHVLMNVVL